MKASINGRDVNSPIKPVVPPKLSEVVLLRSTRPGRKPLMCLRVPTGVSGYLYAFVGEGTVAYCSSHEFASVTAEYIELSRCPIDNLEVNFNAQA